MNRVNLLPASLALALMAAAQPSHAALPPGISGSWYNPEQPGHGLAVQMIAGTPSGVQRSDTFWFVYDTDGNPLHLYLVGEVVGESIQYIAYENRGMRFGVFDPAERIESEWGTVTLAFDSCASATLSWQANDPAYGSGSMPMARLTGIAGLDCALPGAMPDPGSYAVSLQGIVLGAGNAFAAIDASGRLWATPSTTPSGGYVGPHAPVFTSSVASADGEMEVAARENRGTSIGGLQGRTDWVLGATTLEFVQHGGLWMAAGEIDLPGPGSTLGLHVSERPLDPLDRAFSVAELRGRSFTWNGRSQFFNHTTEVRFLEAGNFCVDVQREGGECWFKGQVGAAEPGLAMFAFSGTARGTYYEGKGWLEPTGTGGDRVVLVGEAVAGNEVGAGVGVVGVEQ